MANEQVVEWFGAVAVALMVIFYALERRSPTYVLLFAFACLMSAIYALLLNSYPFLIAEILWAVIAFYRYRVLRESPEIAGINRRE